MTHQTMPTTSDKAKALFRCHGGLLRTSEALRLGIHPRTLYGMRDKGVLEQISRGLYRLTDLPPLGAPDLVTVARKVPAGVICLISALAFHELTTQIPHAVYIALARGAEPPRLDCPPVRIFWFTGDAFTKGIESYKLDQVSVPVYSPEKTLADCCKYRNKLGLEFIMGSPASEVERKDDETPHQVILSRGFWLADTACTQALWQAVMDNNPSHFQGEERPVEQVSWDDVQDFIERLNTGVPGGDFRLPTEAEWEYACRAETITAFWFGDQITPEQVNYDGNYPYAGGRKGLYRKETVAVKALPCNSWGLYQMHGNVWEWCQDWYGRYPQGTVVDPSGPPRGGDRVLRGGGWIDLGRFARSAVRDHDGPGVRIGLFGFRLARGQATSE